MCGIAGVVGPMNVGAAEQILVCDMLDLLRHRGPDGRGTYFEAPNVCLGAVRLAIIDGPASNQPLSSANGSLQLVYNGEIFNYRELRSQLEALGERFRTSGDGEVLLTLYERDPDHFVDNLDGMFAFALWDKSRNRLILGRDRLGIKPLFFGWSAGRIFFASEIKALRLVPNLASEIDREAIQDFVAFRFILAPRTPWKGCYKLEPGSVAVFDETGFHQRRFWVPTLTPESGLGSEQLGLMLRKAVASTSSNDLVNGVFLSGGLDSSCVAALMPHQDARLFSVGYETPCPEDETKYAAEIAEYLQLQHFVAYLDDRQVLECFASVMHALDEPVFTPVCVSTYLLSQLASSHVRVALSGDGSDELFLGYNHFRDIVVSNDRNVSWLNRYAAYLTWLHPKWLSIIDPQYRRGKNEQTPAEVIDERVLRGSAPIDRMRLFELNFKLPEYHLNRVDRLSMAFGLEVRPPFLRNEIVTTALSIPGANLIAGPQDKLALRIAMTGYLPKEPINRAKQKFSAPFVNWLQNALSPLLNDLLLDRQSCVAMGLDPKSVRNLLFEFRRNARAHATTVWGVLTMLAWYNFVGRCSTLHGKEYKW